MNQTTPGTEAGLDLDKLTRYDYVPGEAGRMVIGQDENGTYLLRSDVEAALARQAAPDSATQPVQAGEAVDVKPWQERYEQQRARTPMHASKEAAMQDEIAELRASLAPVSAQLHKADIANTSVNDPIRDYDEFDNPLDGQMGG